MRARRLLKRSDMLNQRWVQVAFLTGAVSATSYAATPPARTARITVPAKNWYELESHLGEHSLPLIKLFSAHTFDRHWMSGLVTSLAANPGQYEANLTLLKRVAEDVARNPSRARLQYQGFDDISRLETDNWWLRFGMEGRGWRFSVTEAPGARVHSAGGR
jgi:hypothetical protein